jgi:hypothetical protein
MPDIIKNDTFVQRDYRLGRRVTDFVRWLTAEICG